MRLCECGCGKEVTKEGNRFIHGHYVVVNNPHPKKEKSDPTLCLCGCGDYAKSGNKYINGHNAKGENNPSKKSGIGEKISKATKGEKKDRNIENNNIGYCKCGCGQKVAKIGNKFIQGHNMKGDINPKLKTKLESSLCSCGCGVYTKTGNEYIHGHNKGHLHYSHTEKTKEELRQYMINGGTERLLKFNIISSSQQNKIFEMVKQKYLDAMLNFQVSNYLIDIAIPEYKIAIEYDGSYWHKNKEKDLKRQKRIESLGWNFIRYVDKIPTNKELIKDIQGGIYGRINS